MPGLHPLSTFAVVSIAIQLTQPLHAHAEEEERKLQLKYSDIESEQNPRRECTPRYMAGPGVGIPLGLATAGLGSAFVFLSTTPSSGSSSGKSNSRAAAIAGAVMIPAGLAAFIYSSVKAKRNRRTRKQVCGWPPRQPWRLDGVGGY